MRKIVLACFLLLSIKSFGLKPDSVYTVKPECWATIYTDMDIKIPDGYTLKAWFFPAQDTVPRDTVIDYYHNPRLRKYQLKDERPRPTIIICNGDSGNMMGLIPFARKYATNGYNVVTFDWRGFGESAPFPIEEDLLCHTEFLIDYHAVIDSVAQMPEVDKSKIGLFGFSTGAYLSFAAAYKNEKVNCFIGRALMTSFDDFLPLLFKLYPEKAGVVRKPLDYPEELYPKNIASYFTQPTLLIVGSEDKRTPVSMSQSIYDDLPGEKELWIVEGASHGGIKGPEYFNQDLFYQKTIGFYNCYLKDY